MTRLPRQAVLHIRLAGNEYDSTSYQFSPDLGEILALRRLLSSIDSATLGVLAGCALAEAEITRFKHFLRFSKGLEEPIGLICDPS